MPKIHPSCTVIVESPTKVRTIQKILGQGYEVLSCMGHIRDLPKKRLGIDIEKGFEPQYIIPPEKKKVVQQLKKGIHQNTLVYLASDPDREGEAIAWHLIYALQLNDQQIQRITFNEITPKAVQAAFQHPRSVRMPLVHAQQARRILDRLVGYKLSPLLWKKVAKRLSAGRVQSVALKLVVERDGEIAQFKPEEYWDIPATFEEPQTHVSFQAKLTQIQGRPFVIRTQSEAQTLEQQLKDLSYTVTLSQEEEKEIAPPPPFITSTLQQEASRRMNFSPKRTMRIAQQLYEGIDVGEQGTLGLITYMRTDSVRLSEEALQALRTYLHDHHPTYLNPAIRRFKSRETAQEAHEAIRPAHLDLTPESLEPYLNKDQARLYSLIWGRFVATQCHNARYLSKHVEITGGDYLFEVSARIPTFEGFHKFYGKDIMENEHLPPLRQGNAVRLLSIQGEQHFSEPPAHYTEASLIKTLEKNGIGRPSTYATIIDTILSRGYVTKEKRQLISSELGRLVVQKLQNYFESVMDVGFTAEMEKKLDRIEAGKENWEAVVHAFYDSFSKNLEVAQEQMPSEKGEVTSELCPECNSPLVVRWSKHGKFYGCQSFPTCRYLRPLEAPPPSSPDHPNPEAPDSGKTCPQCHSPLILKRSRFGPFYGCRAYPQCRYILPSSGPSAPPPAEGEVCEKCGTQLVLKRGRRGSFYACPRYPNCKFTKPIPKDPGG